MPLRVDRIKEQAAAVAERYGKRVTALYLFGSRAANQESTLSDIDLAVLFDPRESATFLELRFALYADFSRSLATNNIDLTVLNTLDNLFILDDIIRSGELIYDGRPDLRLDFEQQALHRALDFKQQRQRVMGI
jgi:predicted nucleotidyltransferase